MDAGQKTYDYDRSRRYSQMKTQKNPAGLSGGYHDLQVSRGDVRLGVFDYNKSQQNQMVHVTMRRVTRFDGLHITNLRGDYEFY